MDPRLSAIRLLRRTGFAEGISFLLLVGVAMPLKYVWHYPIATMIVGSIHGALFIAFVYALVRVGRACRWDIERIAWSFMASILPFGTFVADARIWKKEEAALAAQAP